jgi:hypothetical protein
MEPRFGVDFSSVRVHTDSSAVQMNKDLHAQAFTHGSDIYYGAGKSPAKDDLTAHELTHVVQQTGAKKENETIQAKRSSDDSQEVNPDLNKESPEAITKTAFEKTVSETKPQTDAGKESGFPNPASAY